MTEVLSIQGLSKNFGRIKAVDQLDLNIREGQVFGILGPNGSGKTTTLGMILEIIAPTEGTFTWFGGMDNKSARKKIGSILETPSFYPYLSAVQNLRIVAHIKNCSYSNIDRVIEQVGLTDRKDDRYKTYSLGMKQRLSIASALLADPPILILDEPTNGLDPEGILEVRNLIKEIAKEGKTILLASHLLDEVQKVCTDFCILKNGKKLYEGSVKEILNETNRVEINAPELGKLMTTIGKFGGTEAVHQNEVGLLVTLKDNVTAKDLNQYCYEQGVVLSKLLTLTHSLEEEFMKILKESD